jgi:nucleoside-diphosphate-sugar epimerase
MPFDVITAVTGKDLGISTMRVRKLFAQETKFESDKLAATGFKSAVSIREGISRMVKWWKLAGSKAVPKWRQPPAAVQRFHP